MDALIAVVAIAVFIGAFWAAGLKWWAWFWAAIAAVLGIFEVAAKLVTGQTLSQQFWGYMAAHPTQGWLLAGLVAVGAVGLVVHLVWKRLTHKGD